MGRPAPSSSRPVPAPAFGVSSEPSSWTMESSLPAAPSTSSQSQTQASETVEWTDDDNDNDTTMHDDGGGDGLPEPRKHKVYYFAYGTDLYRPHMKTTMPEAVSLGLARLDGYRWLLCGPPRPDHECPPTRTSKPSPEGRATIAKAEAGTKGAVVYGWLYIVSAARLWECKAAETYDYELQTLPSMTLLGRDPAFWRGNSVKEKAKTEAPAKEPIFASLPYPLRGVRVIPNSRARALVASARRYAMPRRFPGTWHAKGMSPGFLDAAPARTPSEEDSRDERTSNDDLMTVFRDAIKRSVTLRDEERAAARPFLEVAMRESRHKDWEVRSPEEAAAIAALRSPFPDIEEARRVRGEWDRFEGSPSEIVKALEAMDAAIQPRNRPLADCINDSPNTSRNASASTAVLHPDSSLDLDYLLMLDEGIRWALTTEGLLPQWYVDEVVRPWLPYKQSLDGQKSERERQKNGKLAEPMTTRRGRHAATHPTLIREDAMAWPETTQVFSGRLRSSRVG